MTEEEFLRRMDRHTEAALAIGIDLKHEIARTNDTLATMKEHLARANEHMARGNEHMARGDEHMARGNELMDEIRRASSASTRVVRPAGSSMTCTPRAVPGAMRCS